MVRRGASLDANQAGWQLLKECQHVAALQLAADDHLAGGINPVDLENRLGDVETDCRVVCIWLLRIMGALTAAPFVARPCRWRSRPQHQKRTCRNQWRSASQQTSQRAGPIHLI